MKQIFQFFLFWSLVALIGAGCIGLKNHVQPTEVMPVPPFVQKCADGCKLSGLQAVAWGICQPNELGAKQVAWFSWQDPWSEGTISFMFDQEIEPLKQVELALCSAAEQIEKKFEPEDPRVIHIGDGFAVNDQQWLLPGGKATWFFLRGKDFSRQFLDRVGQELLSQRAMRSWEIRGEFPKK